MCELTIDQYLADVRLHPGQRDPILEVWQRQARLERVINLYPSNNRGNPVRAMYCTVSH